MTESRNDVLQVVLAALAEFNQDLAQGNPLPLSEQTSLAPGSGTLDSLGFINLVTLLETHLENRLGLSLPLAEATEAAGEPSPWRSVEALTDFIVARLGAASAARN